MATKKKLLQAAAGSAGGAGGLNVEEVFSTYLYVGNGSSQTITNNLDLSNEGGLVWLKARDDARDNRLLDTERGASAFIQSNTTDEQYVYPGYGVTSFNSNGFTVSDNSSGSYASNGNSFEYASWSWRKAPKFFDVVTWTGNGSNNRAIPHSLGSVPGMIWIKNLNNSGTGWLVWHRSQGNSKYGVLNLANSFNSGSLYWPTAHTDTDFYVSNGYNDAWSNGNGANYVAYVFAHNNGDGDFGPTGDQDIIKCGTYSGNGGPLDVDLGWEAQWVLIKRADTNGYDWHIFDSMRGMPVDYDAKWLETNTNGTEQNNTYISVHPRGFTLPLGHPEVNQNGGTYVYMAVRRGPMAIPDDATTVFGMDPDGADGQGPTVGFVTDFSLLKRENVQSGWFLTDRVRAPAYSFANSNSSETNSGNIAYDRNNGAWDGPLADYFFWAWARAPKYFDVVSYKGDGIAGGRYHNLEASPEMIWVKSRDSSYDWQVWHKDLTSGYHLILNNTGAEINSNSPGLGTVSDTTFNVGSYVAVNQSGLYHVAYLFASLDGISKVGSYTGNGSSSVINIDCGFSSGARFVLIKRTDTTSDWYLFDTERGIYDNSTDEPYLLLNTQDAQSSNTNYLSTYSSGFGISTYGGSPLNASGGTYIFYAIA